MITQVTSAAAELAAAVAASVAATLASSEPLTASTPSGGAADLGGCAHAVLVGFTGSATGELAICVDAEFSDPLSSSELGALEIVQALRPVVEAAGAAIGSVTLGSAELLDTAAALQRVDEHADTAVVALRGAHAVRAGVAIGLDSAPAEGTTETDSSSYDQRLDLLRGVQMEATAELGRARMTINDLLSLRNGAVIELDRPAGGPADLFVNGRLIARGEVVVIDENFGLRITQVVTTETGR